MSRLDGLLTAQRSYSIRSCRRSAKVEGAKSVWAYPGLSEEWYAMIFRAGAQWYAGTRIQKYKLFDHPRVEFVYEDRWVKVKVTGTKKVEYSYFRNVIDRQ